MKQYPIYTYSVSIHYESYNFALAKQEQHPIYWKYRQQNKRLLSTYLCKNSEHRVKADHCIVDSFDLQSCNFGLGILLVVHVDSIAFLVVLRTPSPLRLYFCCRRVGSVAHFFRHRSHFDQRFGHNLPHFLLLLLLLLIA